MKVTGYFSVHALAVAGALLANTGNGSAADPDPFGVVNLAKEALVDTSVPTSPAMTVLGVTTENVIRPRSPDELGLSLLNNVDQHGNFQSGLALDINPSKLFLFKDTTLEGYRTNYSERFWANTQISLATAQGQEEADKSTKLALGFHFTPWISKNDDPRRAGYDDTTKKYADDSLVGCLLRRGKDARATAERKFAEMYPGLSAFSTEGRAKLETLVRTELAAASETGSKKCREKWNQDHQSVSAWTIGFTPTWTSKDHDLDDLSYSGVALWSSLSLKLKDLGKLPLGGGDGEAIFHVRYRGDEVVANPLGDGTFLDQDTFMASFQMRFGSSAKEDREGDMLKDVRYSVEGAYVNADRSDGVNDDYFVWSGKAEFRVPQLGENLWLNVNAGRSTGRVDQEESFGGLSINWAFNDKKGK